MNKTTDFWALTLTCLICALFLTIVTSICLMWSMKQKVEEVQMQMNEVQSEHEELKKWVGENEYVMRTYKFFNESWQAIIDLHREED